MKLHAKLNAKNCDYCNGLIMDSDYYLIDLDSKSFGDAYTKDSLKMCNKCYRRLSIRKVKTDKLDQIDAFPDYPRKEKE